MIENKIVPADFQGIESLDSEVLLLPVFVEERPLKGVAGFVDWQLNGYLSGLVINRLFLPNDGGLLLFPTRATFPVPKILMYGMGKVKELTIPKILLHYRKIMEVLSRAKFISFAAPLPGSILSPLSVDDLATAWVQMINNHYSGENVITLIPKQHTHSLQAALLRSKRK